ncbi:hypothetical protein PIB30_012226 [Stylosanthes scabra]|uniref:Uncharacterized protein n=1 Tax=Stylosanthes scabra TaxID=79078 RepID=A0ABU6V4Z5_9FABA|nr:hypothetical protein [Stylosanthes scabra]
MSLSAKFMKSLRKQVMELYYSCNQGYTPWNPTPYQPHDLGYNTYQSNGFGDAYYGYEDPSSPYPPSQNGMNKLFEALTQERNEIREVQRKTEIQLDLMIKLATLVIEYLNNYSNISQPSNSENLPSQPLSNPWRSLGTLFLYTNQERREDTLLNEEDVESFHACLEEVEEENEAQVAEDVNQEVEDNDKEPKGMEIVHFASSEVTPSKLPSELQFDLRGGVGRKGRGLRELDAELKAHKEHLNKLHNNRVKVGALSLMKHLGPWKFQEKLGGTNQVWDLGKSFKNHHFWGVIACVGVFMDLLSMNWDPLEPTKFKHWWEFKDEFNHKPP